MQHLKRYFKESEGLHEQKAKKKQFKKRFGFNPPRNISMQTATRIMENKESVIAACERLKAAINDLWEQLKKPLLELVEALKEIKTAFIDHMERNRRQYAALANFQSKVLVQQRQKEKEVMQIESNFNIYNHDRK